MTDRDEDGRLRWLRTLPSTGGDLQFDDIRTRLDETPIALIIEATDAGTFSAQATAFTAVNLLSRLFRRLVIVAPVAATADVRVPFAAGSLGPALISFAARVHPQVHATLAAAPPTDSVILHIAPFTPTTNAAAVYCGGAGWLAHVSRRPFMGTAASDDANPIGPVVAAALGVAEVFKVVFGDIVAGIVPADGIRFSALTYATDDKDPGPPLGPITLPDTTLVGVGSIGSAFLWGLAHLPAIRGRLAIVDPDALAAHNPDRAILVLDDAAARKLPKATWARDTVQPSLPHLAVTYFDGTIREYVDTLPPDYRLPLAVSAVDSLEARRDIQDALPRRILNASTGPTKVEVSRHGFGGDGPCLYCLYLPEVLERAPIRVATACTGFAPKTVAEMLMPNSQHRLSAGNLRGIERHNDLPPGMLRGFEQRPLQDLLADRLWYSQAPVPLADGHALVTTAFVSALAGILLLAETIKEATPTLAQYRLMSVYEQELLGVPNGFVYPGERDSTGYCLCHDPLRVRLYGEKYGGGFHNEVRSIT